MTPIQSILEIANRMEKSAESEEKQGRYDVEALLRGYVTELRKATVVMADVAVDADTTKKSRKSAHSSHGGKERTSVHDLHIDKELKQ